MNKVTKSTTKSDNVSLVLKYKEIFKRHKELIQENLDAYSQREPSALDLLSKELICQNDFDIEEGVDSIKALFEWINRKGRVFEAINEILQEDLNKLCIANQALNQLKQICSQMPSQLKADSKAEWLNDAVVAVQNVYKNGEVQYGYRLDRYLNCLVIEDCEADIVKQIYENYLYGGFTVSNIVNTNNAVSSSKAFRFKVVVRNNSKMDVE